MVNDDLVFQYKMTAKGVKRYKNELMDIQNDIKSQIKKIKNESDILIKIFERQHKQKLHDRCAAIDKRVLQNCEAITSLTSQLAANKQACSIKSEIIKSLEDTAYYMEHSKFPFNEGAQKQNKQKQTLLVDEYFMTIYGKKNDQTEMEQEVNEFDSKMINDLMKALTVREKECYVLVYQELFYPSEVAAMLGIDQNTVKTNIRRAKNKIANQKKKSLFVQARGWSD
ncbi:hypothetical protein HCB69_16020 [Listeria booriae]|uniref:RNA polymerase sigma factor 70 region 4 type 2 domain-containing protein n=1 Tax=Listeria booriae TaxID=1552123 RepID=A0A842FUG2_9LIST|nr:sigma factor-like helix-turn-helix DNA-binding protein [Listeria booriae]MBC2285883.1 hypothetical protein [Listeria booriae]